MILSQLVDAEVLKQLTPEALREMILDLDHQIEQGANEKLLISIEANIVGVKGDHPAGANYEVSREPASDVEWHKKLGKGGQNAKC